MLLVGEVMLGLGTVGLVNLTVTPSVVLSAGDGSQQQQNIRQHHCTQLRYE